MSISRMEQLAPYDERTSLVAFRVKLRSRNMSARTDTNTNAYTKGITIFIPYEARPRLPLHWLGRLTPTRPHLWSALLD